jgi:hypothetical protein
MFPHIDELWTTYDRDANIPTAVSLFRIELLKNPTSKEVTIAGKVGKAQFILDPADVV